MAEIRLTNGKIVIVDDEDFEWLSRWTWRAMLCVGGRTWYAVRRGVVSEAPPWTILMHRQIIGAKPGQKVDHRDCDGLNNQRSNLRFATDSENTANSRKQLIRYGSPCASQHKGVTRSHRKNTPWRARIRFGHRSQFLGYFKTELEAARAYDTAAIQMHGEFARLNFPAVREKAEP